MNNIKGILCDLDNTLYDYEQTHAIALKNALDFFYTKTKINTQEGDALYFKARKQINSELKNTAASHNRLLYFQRMTELIDHRTLSFALDAYHCYWNAFIKNITLFDGVLDFFSTKKQRLISIVTDLTADVQHRKLHDLNLFQHIDYLITSEEAGADKPHPEMFQITLKKMKCRPDQVLMIGDNYEKDILGANQCGILGLWLNRDGITHDYNQDLVKEFTSFKNIHTFLNDD